jgi:tRNA threonylcarbamoyladenosine biosynthesis protein TsaE
MPFRLNSEEETRACGRALASSLKQGDVIALQGELGAGKSVFARALMRGLGVSDKVMPSPTFTLIQTYDGRDCKVAHMDWYRLEDADEIEMLGVREYFSPPWISIIEWPERAPGLLPDHAIHIKLECVENDACGRLISISRFGKSMPLLTT